MEMLSSKSKEVRTIVGLYAAYNKGQIVSGSQGKALRDNVDSR
jgi:hypothetical protein